jgi:2-polyprenyl-6-methoxyphenol hydroxylase-like FAD-dependent oxidoreductase
MRVIVVGAGPAGLYFSYLLKRRRPAAAVAVYEQNPPGATFGFGVVFSDRALEFLQADDPDTHAALDPELERWSDIALDHRGRTVIVDGVGFAAIGRLRLLQLLRRRAASVGVALHDNHVFRDAAAFAGADLVVGADGVNSFVRQAFAAELGSSVRPLANRYAWFGTARPFDRLTQTFRQTPDGFFNAHHYRYAPDRSTFIVEVDPATFARSGLDAMPPDAAKAYCEQVFAETLGGHELMSNNTQWRQFPKIHNRRWWSGRAVLLGDALHTAHFSIGSGTRLAMEDAIALDAALARHPRAMDDALAAFESARRPIVDKLVAAADSSAAWYEDFPTHMRLDPLDFAFGFLTRTGRVDPARLRAACPRFMAEYDAGRRAAAP